uniref:Protein NEOXANTHIN-DEFICIENT 1 n=1 Tax=Oryza punctata TaxID=4537 RepID=A0A0E0M9B9_ORYPU
MAAGSGREEAAAGAGAGGYGRGPPWVALYQLHLVKAATARAFVPKELRLVEAFGYTLGGMFLARYDDSPAGKFDEVSSRLVFSGDLSPSLTPFLDRISRCLSLQLVVIAGIVWNPPTSCAWAARVLVNSAQACRHGRKEVGLPSHVATFSQTEADALRNKPLVKSNGFLRLLGMRSTVSKQGNDHEIEISETKGSCTRHLCNISVPLTGSNKHKWMGPAIRMSLPSFSSKLNMTCTVNFSGQIEDHPDLLKYSCQVECRVRPVRPAKIWRPRIAEPQECPDGKISSKGSEVLAEPDAQKHTVMVLLSKPILALEFNSLEMLVDAPKIVVPHSKKKEVRYSST